MSPSAAQDYYDRFGKKQDSQGFYEDPALDELIAHAGFSEARKIFEFGCGTGKFAVRLLERHLPSSAGYIGYDVSPVMVGLAERRLEAYAERAQVILSDGVVQFPLPDLSVDRVVSSYVLDLLSEKDIRRFFLEAHRVLAPGGRICLASLTTGSTLLSRIVSSLWTAVFQLSPATVGGCRPVHLDAFVDHHHWQVAHQRVVAPYGVPSEVLVLDKKGSPSSGPEPTAPGAAAQPK